MAAAAIDFLPDSVPLHYNIFGAIDRIGSKYEMLILPFAVALVALIGGLLSRSFRRKAEKCDGRAQAEAERNGKIIDISAIVVATLLIAVQVVAIYSAFAYSEKGGAEIIPEADTLLGVIIGIGTAVLGNIMPKAKRNAVFGLRTSWSMENDKTWEASNRFGGMLMMAGGIMIVALSLICRGMAGLISLIIISLVTIASIVYSYYAYMKYKDN